MDFLSRKEILSSIFQDHASDNLLAPYKYVVPLFKDEDSIAASNYFVAKVNPATKELEGTTLSFSDMTGKNAVPKEHESNTLPLDNLSMGALANAAAEILIKIDPAKYDALGETSTIDTVEEALKGIQEENKGYFRRYSSFSEHSTEDLQTVDRVLELMSLRKQLIEVMKAPEHIWGFEETERAAKNQSVLDILNKKPEEPVGTEAIKSAPPTP